MTITGEAKVMTDQVWPDVVKDVWPLL